MRYTKWSFYYLPRIKKLFSIIPPVAVEVLAVAVMWGVIITAYYLRVN